MKAFLYNAMQVNELRALHDHVIVSDMSFDERLSNGGVLLRSDDMKSQGVKPRWARVYAVGPKQTDVKVGEWVLITHGRWTRGVLIRDASGEEYTVRRVDTNDLLMVTDEQPADNTIGSG